jgi:hypothetical protein
MKPVQQAQSQRRMQELRVLQRARDVTDDPQINTGQMLARQSKMAKEITMGKV